MSNFNLSLHCGSHRVNEEDLQEVQTPAATDTWNPLPHTALNGLVHAAIANVGLVIAQQAHALMRDGDFYFSMLELEDPDSEFTTVVGLRNSHNKRFGAGLVAGNGVFVCDNLCFFGEVKITKRHTPDIGLLLPGLIENAVERLTGTVANQRRKYQGYKNGVITEKTAARLIMALYEVGAITGGQIPHVWDELFAPQHPEFEADHLTQWKLYNAVTEQFKGSPALLTARSAATHSIIDTGAPDQVFDVEYAQDDSKKA